MKSKPPAELTARRKAYAALAAAYDRDAAQPLYLDQVRRDVEAAHRNYNKVKETTHADSLQKAR